MVGSPVGLGCAYRVWSEVWDGDGGCWQSGFEGLGRSGAGSEGEEMGVGSFLSCRCMGRGDGEVAGLLGKEDGAGGGTESRYSFS